ncbi:type II TA system antitoxin MqsA family protein [Paenibacillus jiagnxiensis]|uniref:type II TA system antitoxin MqsA family protein n=1 Tax=Paenibacillus jiagnxiensis TaxID=3228926 RepID=UPI0033A9CB8E
MKETRTRFCDECDCERTVRVLERRESMPFGGEYFDIIRRVAICEVCGHEVYDEELDTETLQTLSKAYEKKHSINATFIKDIRSFFGMTQPIFAKILNMGVATIKRYETGQSIPNKTQAGIFNILKKDPENITQYYEENKHKLTTHEQKIVEERLNKLFEKKNKVQATLHNLLIMNYNHFKQSKDNGETGFYLKKLISLIQYLSKNGVLKTKLMKLMWYADFLMYKRNFTSITGMVYVHKPYGPVPKDHDFLLSCLETLGEIRISTEESNNGYTRITIKSNKQPNESYFTDKEISVIKDILTFFEDYNSTKISNFAHETDAWKQTKEDQIISYDYAKSIQLL